MEVSALDAGLWVIVDGGSLATLFVPKVLQVQLLDSDLAGLILGSMLPGRVGTVQFFLLGRAGLSYPITIIWL